MIKVSGLEYRYKGNKTSTLKGVDFEVADGEVVALVGQNGSGKSTIGRIISGIFRLQKGEVWIDNKKLGKKANKMPEGVGIVFQNPENQIIFNRIDDEIGFALQDLSPAERNERISEALRRVGMSEFRNHDLYNLSLGQKQRIILAEALARQPKCLILDEPTTMIDSQGKEEIYHIIRNLKKRGLTIICITNLADEMLLADRTLILADGKIAAEIKRSELVKKSHLLTKHDIHRPTLLKILHELDQQGVKIDLDDWTTQELAQKVKEKLNANR